MKIYVATKNQTKINLVKKMFGNSFGEKETEVVGCDVSSGVSATPQSDQNYLGAHNRALNAQKLFKDGDFYVGLETGLVEKNNKIFEETWCCIINSEGREFVGYSSGNKIDDGVRYEFVEDEDSKSTSVFVKDLTGRLVQFSGNLELREIEIENSIEIALAQMNILNE